MAYIPPAYSAGDLREVGQELWHLCRLLQVFHHYILRQWYVQLLVVQLHSAM